MGGVRRRGQKWCLQPRFPRGPFSLRPVRLGGRANRRVCNYIGDTQAPGPSATWLHGAPIMPVPCLGLDWACSGRTSSRQRPLALSEGTPAYGTVGFEKGPQIDDVTNKRRDYHVILKGAYLICGAVP